MAAIDDLNTSLSNVASLIAQITASPQPSYSVDGQSVSWSEYLAMLTERMETIQDMIIVLGGPYQLVAQAVT